MNNPIATAVVGTIAAFTGLTVLFGSWYTIDQGERGVLLRNREIVNIIEPGLHFKIPVIDSMAKFSIQTHIVQYANMAAYSRDQQPTTMTVSVNYQLNPAEVDLVYSEYGSEEQLVARLISPRVESRVKNIFGKFNAVSAIQERERLNMEIKDAIQQAVQGPVIIEDVQVESIDFSAAYEQSIEQRMLAEVDVEKVEQNLAKEKVTAEITVTQAQAEADSTLARARAEAEAIRIRGQAEAEAIDARGQALRDNPELVSLVQAEKWNGVLPTTMIPGSTVPFMNMAQ
jgi:regulator of protease activity HflC (stomatin/prohibitin superfamily)